jgi:predicted Rossmann fold flavoprotein
VLEAELKRLSVCVETDFAVTGIESNGDDFLVTSKSHKKARSARLIIAGGGRSYPALGSDGSSYDLTRPFGHTIVEPVPVAVPLVIKDILCHLLQGQKIRADARSLAGGKVTSEASGEVLFTKYGLSGTAILDISEEISVAINREKGKDAEVSVDMVPFMGKDELKEELARRLSRKVPAEDILAGILPNKFAVALRELFNGSDPGRAAAALKDRRFKVLGTRGWNEAEFTAGGIDVREVKSPSLESKLKKNLYFAGEVLDVNGERGGYNLAWAWASGFVAGSTG